MPLNGHAIRKRLWYQRKAIMILSFQVEKSLCFQMMVINSFVSIKQNKKNLPDAMATFVIFICCFKRCH